MQLHVFSGIYRVSLGLLGVAQDLVSTRLYGGFGGAP